MYDFYATNKVNTGALLREGTGVRTLWHQSLHNLASSMLWSKNLRQRWPQEIEWYRRLLKPNRKGAKEGRGKWGGGGGNHIGDTVDGYTWLSKRRYKDCITTTCTSRHTTVAYFYLYGNTPPSVSTNKRRRKNLTPAYQPSNWLNWSSVVITMAGSRDTTLNALIWHI